MQMGCGGISLDGDMTALVSNVTAVCANAFPFKVAPVFSTIAV